MSRSFALLIVGCCLSPVAALEVDYEGSLSTDYRSDTMITIEFVADNTLAVADAEGVVLFDVLRSARTTLPVDRLVSLPMARFVLSQSQKNEETGVFSFHESAPRGPRPQYVYNSNASQLCNLNEASDIERSECLDGLDYYFEVESPWQDDRALVRNFELYRVDPVTQRRELLDHRPAGDVFPGSNRASTMIVDTTEDNRLLFLVGSAPVDGRPFVGTLSETGTVTDTVWLEEAEGYTRNAAFVGNRHVAVPVDGEATGGHERLYTVGIFDLSGNRVAEIEDVQFFDFRQQFDVSADGRWLAVLGYHRDLDEHGLFLYELFLD